MTGSPACTLKVILIGYMHGRGGIQTHTRFLAEGLRERGHAVEVVSPPPMAEHGESDRAEGVQCYSGLRDLVKRVRSARADVVVVVGTGWKAMLGALAAGARTRKVFFEVMSGARERFLDPRMLVRFGFDAVVGQGEPVTRRFATEFGWDGPTRTIPALPEPLERQLVIPPRTLRPVSDGVRFAYFGRVSAPKNVRLLIDEFDAFAGDSGTLDIWGQGDDADRISSLIDQRGLGDRIHMRGRYPEGQAYVELLQGYDLLLLPTIAQEGAPLVLLEAMACGLPFVANGMGGIPDYENADCIVTNGDITQFIPSVEAMVSRIEAGEIDPGRLQDHYARQFSFERLNERWEEFLCSI